jgi:hypothetical protein
MKELKMKITGLHLLLTYQCTFACDHCFVWGSPAQSGVMSLEDIRRIYDQVQALGTVRSFYFEGGEPFLYYAVLVQAVREAHARGFEVGIVSNAYWANSPADAKANLEPLAGLVSDLTVSSDLFHYSELLSAQARHAAAAAVAVGIPCGLIQIAPVEAAGSGQIPDGESGVMYRGRAAEKLAPAAPHYPWQSFTTCPHEDLVDPGRVHVDPLGNVHLCQGIVLGNLFQTPLEELAAGYVPEEHPITGPLLAGGPAELARRCGFQPEAAYADACHLCYSARAGLRERFPQELGPDQMYGG